MIWQDPHIIADGLRDQACADLLVARFVLRSRAFNINGRQTTFAHLVVAKCQQACEKLLKGYLLFHDRHFDPASGHTPMTDMTELSERQRERLTWLFTILNRGNPRTVNDVKWVESHAPHRPRPMIGDTPAPLGAMPVGMQFPEHLRDRVRYDNATQALVVSDRLSREEKQELLALSNDPPYQAAVESACTEAADKAGLPQPLQIIQRNSEYPFWSDSSPALVIPAEALSLGDGRQAMRTTMSFFRTFSRSGPPQYTKPIGGFLDDYPMSTNLDEFPEP